MEQPERRCLACEKPLPPGRTDKRYCDDVCRARATRKRSKEDIYNYENRHRPVIDAIKRNHRLMKKALLGREEWIADFYGLYVNGFDRAFHTCSEVSANGKTRYYCFELGWEELDNGEIRISIDPAKLSVYDHRRETGYGTHFSADDFS